MDIWEVAKNMELEGQQFYTDLANTVEIDELKGVFLFLADQENDHFNLFESMQNGDKPTYKSVKDALSVARTAFAGIAPDFSAPESLAAAATAYARAAELEDSAIKYYTSLLSQVNDDSGKQILKSIIDEERKHKALMESIIEFASTPNEWLEEFGINQIDDFRLDS